MIVVRGSLQPTADEVANNTRHHDELGRLSKKDFKLQCRCLDGVFLGCLWNEFDMCMHDNEMEIE